jgi:hypothetical protein
MVLISAMDVGRSQGPSAGDGRDECEHRAFRGLRQNEWQGSDALREAIQSYVDMRRRAMARQDVAAALKLELGDAALVTRYGMVAGYGDRWTGVQMNK